MKRALCMTVVALMIPLLAGCVAISAKGVPQSSRYTAVATDGGTIYVVDLRERTATPVRILTEGEPIE